MGLLDILNGMQNGPRGAPAPSSGQSGGGGMSPLTMAILGLLAWRAVRSLGGQAQPANTRPTPPLPGNNPDARIPAGQAGQGQSQSGQTGQGGLGDLLGGGNLGGTLGGLLAGGAAGSILSGGLNDLLKQFQDSGKGDAAKSWVGNGPNHSISPNDLASALGSDQINALTSQTGISREELLSGLSDQLPEVVNQLTPHGRMPTEDEASEWA
jgi:uncharacterized protein YidB (DUF937 family)